MSGTQQAWTPERRARQSALMTRQNSDPDFLAKRNAGMKSDFNRLRKAQQMRNLCRRRRDDPKFHARWLAAIAAVNATPERRAQSRDVLAAVKRLVQQEFDLPHRVAKRKKRAAKTGDTKRGFHVPEDLLPLYRAIRPKVGAQEARRLIEAELARRS